MVIQMQRAKKITLGTPEAITPVKFSNVNNNLIQGDVTYDTSLIRFKVTASGCVIEMPLDPDEEVFGFGLQLKGFDHRGTKKYLRPNADPVANTGDSHAPVPFFVTTKGYGVYVDTARYASFYCGFGKNKNRENIRNKAVAVTPEELYEKNKTDEITQMIIDIPAAKGVDLYIFEGDSITEIVAAYNQFSGGGCMPSLWGLGMFYRCYTRYTQEEIIKMADYFRENDIPCDMIGLEPGWQESSYSCSYLWDKDRIPDPDSLIKELRNRHYNINLWEHVFVNSTSPIYRPLNKYSGDFEVWQGLVPDFGTKEGVDIFSEYHKTNFIDKGILGFKLDECDGSDYTGSWSYPNCSEFPSGMNGEQMHSMIGNLYQQTILKALGNNRTLSEVRSAGALAAPYPFVLYSDLYEHKDFIRGLVNSGFSGLLWTPEVRHADSKEELIRRVQAVIFSPQAIINGWYIDKAPWIDMRATNEIKGLFEVRMQLVPYIYSAFYQYYKKGIAPVRALVSDYSSDQNTYKIDDEYLFGDSLLVAPILAGETKRTVYLPKGKWYDFWTNQKYKGGYHIMETDTIPVFVKDNSILPLAQPVMYMEEGTQFKLDIKVYGSGGTIILIEDNGMTYDTNYKEYILTGNKDEDEQVILDSSRYCINSVQYF